MRRRVSTLNRGRMVRALLALGAGLALVAGCGGGGGGSTTPAIQEGTLVLRSTPAGATVLINGEEIPQKTPVEVTRQVAATGTTFEVVLRLAGYEEVRQTVLVRPNQAATVEVALKASRPPEIPPHTISGRVLYNPGSGTFVPAANATVSAKETTTNETFAATMDTTPQRAGTYYIFAPPGTYVVTATLTGYPPQTANVTVLSGEDRHTDVNFNLKK
ncbi:MAG: PEGA domain-containing protein [Armatimonadetes bacterium]|jgi:hypothetical protein|nr:PEGA domain-containing protein [Armatimonadota bacterium]